MVKGGGSILVGGPTFEVEFRGDECVKRGMEASRSMSDCNRADKRRRDQNRVKDDDGGK